MKQINPKHIIDSLQTLNSFAAGEHTLSGSEEFLNLYVKTQTTLINLGNERATIFYKNVVAQYPEFTMSELDELIKVRDGHRSFIQIFVGLPYIIWNFIKDLKRSRDKNSVLKKLEAMVKLNNKCIDEIKNPGIEEFYAMSQSKTETL